MKVKKFKKMCAWFLTVAMIFSLITAVPLTVSASNTTYYVDALNGNDNNNGTSTGTAWRTLIKVNNTTFQPGDRILFKSGCTWDGQLWPKGSGESGNPIVPEVQPMQSIAIPLLLQTMNREEIRKTGCSEVLETVSTGRWWTPGPMRHSAAGDKRRITALAIPMLIRYTGWR